MRGDRQGLPVTRNNMIKRKHKLLPKEIAKRLPSLQKALAMGMDAVAQVKFFTPDSGWTWYATGYDGKDTFYGRVFGVEDEMGAFSLSELESVRGPWGLPIERDFYFKPKPLSQLKY